jgi:hypothetical protein
MGSHDDRYFALVNRQKVGLKLSYFLSHYYRVSRGVCMIEINTLAGSSGPEELSCFVEIESGGEHRPITVHDDHSNCGISV